METYSFGSLSGSTVASVLFSALAGLIALSIRLLGASTRRDTPRAFLTPQSRWSPWITPSIVAAMLLALVYWWLWTDFYRAELTSDSLTLRYHVPDRAVSLRRADVADARIVFGNKLALHVLVRTCDGRRYRSATVHGVTSRVQPLLDALAATSRCAAP